MTNSKVRDVHISAALIHVGPPAPSTLPKFYFFFFKTKDEPTMTHHSHPISVLYLRVHSYYLDKWIMAYICHYNIIQSIFSVWKFLCVLDIHLFLFNSPPLVTINLFIVAIVLPFPECHIFAIIQYDIFSYWLFPFSSMHLRYLPMFSGLIVYFLFFSFQCFI